MKHQLTGRSARKGGNPQNQKTLLVLDECHLAPGNLGKLTSKILQMIGRIGPFDQVTANPPYQGGVKVILASTGGLHSLVVGNPPYPEVKAGTSRCRSPKLKGISSRCRSPISMIVANPPYPKGKPGTSQCRSPF